MPSTQHLAKGWPSPPLCSVSGQSGAGCPTPVSRTQSARTASVCTFSMTRSPPKRVTNSAGEATVKSLCRSTFLCSRPLFTRWSPDMLGLGGGRTDVREPGSLDARGRSQAPGTHKSPQEADAHQTPAAWQPPSLGDLKTLSSQRDSRGQHAIHPKGSLSSPDSPSYLNYILNFSS